MCMNLMHSEMENKLREYVNMFIYMYDVYAPVETQMFGFVLK